MTEKKKRPISPSQIDMFSRCGEQYRRRYIEKDRLPPGVAMIRGRGVHEGVAENMRQKRHTYCDLPP